MDEGNDDRIPTIPTDPTTPPSNGAGVIHITPNWGKFIAGYFALR